MTIATELVPADYGRGAVLAVAVAGGPRHQVLRPATLEDPDFQKRLQRHALLSEAAVLNIEEGTKRRFEDDHLRLEQESSLAILTQAGDMCVVAPAIRQRERLELPAIIQEDVVEAIARALRFMSAVLKDIDPVRRLNRVVPVAALLNAGYTGWRTRQEHRRQPHTAQMSSRTSDRPTSLRPPGLARGRLDVAVGEIAEDLMVLLRRDFKR